MGRAAVRRTTPAYRVGVLVVLRRSDGRVLLVDQPYVPGWSLPGGDLKGRETVQACGRRELREELGLELDVPPPVLAVQRTSDRWIVYVTTVDVGDEIAERPRPTSVELRDAAWFSPDALPDLHGEAVAPLRLAGVLPPA